MTKPWMIYGANGYTGRMIAEKAAKQGLKPILAGRNRAEIEELGAKLQLPTRVFPCQNENDIAANLNDVSLVLHCAGPFSATASPMVKACMQAKTHYLDITGEIGVFEKIHRRSLEIARAGIVAIPGVGFDVVPSDCLAAMLKEKLPDATDLELILKPSGTFSPGTAKTMVEGFYVGTAIRKDGKIQIQDHFAVEQRKFQNKTVNVMGIAWGDVSTAFHSTGIPNVRVYMVSSPKYMHFLKAVQKLKFLLALPPTQKLLKKLVDWRVSGPEEAERAGSGYKLWGIVKNREGKTVEMGISTPNGYTFTVDSALDCVDKLLKNRLAPGAYTPSRAFGSKFVLDLPDVRLI